MAKPVKVAIDYIQTGEPIDPSIPNRPIQNLESNIDNILQYLTNDGAGSTIDADYLDGQHGSYYLAFSNFTGTLVASQFNDTAHGTRSGGSLHALASGTVAGFMSSSDKSKLDSIAANANNYSLPTASATTLGGVKIGGGLSITNGVLSANVQGQYSLPTASASTLGGVKIGSRISIASGVLSADVQSDENFTTTLLNKLNGIATNANNYSLPTASGTVLGGVKVGTDLTITSGVLSVNSSNYAKLNVANTFSQSQNAPAWNSTSDRRLKENINWVDPRNLNFDPLGLYEFDYKETGIHSIGTMADEAWLVSPLVTGFDEFGAPNSVDYARLAFLLAMHNYHQLKSIMGQS